ncbi:hypothetical protein AB4Z32_02440 [Massilia sp. 2TAF26]|uniref:hypothetical protein n=1 Tax=Massilia sp. 2TAF26 TaxID=3233012 RepID=UPI003F9A7A58
MSQEIKNIKEAGALVLRAWRQASPFFLSIELLLMLLLSFVSVAGVWLAVIGDLRCLLAFGAAGAYLTARPLLHVKRVLAWPFMR